MSKDMALIILTDTASSLSHQHCMTASAMDQIYFCSELGVREPGSQLRGKGTRADWGSWEEQGKVGEAGSNLAKLASSQTSAESQARGNSYSGNREEPIWEPGKRKEAVKDTQCRARVLIPESQVAPMMLDESPHCPGLQTAHLPNSRSGWAFLARSFALLEFWFLMENSEEKKKKSLPFYYLNLQNWGSFSFGGFVPVVLFPFPAASQEVMISSQIRPE